jgi:hypothetical protein
MPYAKVNNDPWIHMGPGGEEKYHGEFLIPNSIMIPHVHDPGFGYTVIISDRKRETVCPLVIETPALTFCADAVAAYIRNPTTANWMTAFFMATSPEPSLISRKYVSIDCRLTG